MSKSKPATITKKELVNRIAEETHQTKVVVKDILQRLLNTIVRELAQGNRIEFREFGVFEVRQRAARTAQNPRTLQKVVVPSKRVVKFKVGRMMRERVCSEPLTPTRRKAAVRAPESASKPKPPTQPPPSDSPF